MTLVPTLRPPRPEPVASSRPRGRRWWRIALAALAIVALAEAAARAVAPSLAPVYDWPDSSYVSHDQQLAASGDDVDLLVVGSSSVGIAIRPDDLTTDGAAGPGFNFWLAGPGMRSIALLTTEVLLERTSPSTVIVGVTMRELNGTDALASHVAALQESPAFLEATGQQSWIGRLDDRFQRYSALARHRGTLRDPIELIYQIGAPELVPDPIENDGYLDGAGDHRLADEPAEHRQQEQQAMAGYVLSAADVDALAGLLDELDRRGIRALVVNLPVTDGFVDMADDGDADYREYVAAVEATTTSHHGEWLDTMQRDWPDQYFGDGNHLNELGAQRLRPLVVAALGEG
jgi:hypothetical protein